MTPLSGKIKEGGIQKGTEGATGWLSQLSI